MNAEEAASTEWTPTKWDPTLLLPRPWAEDEIDPSKRGTWGSIHCGDPAIAQYVAKTLNAAPPPHAEKRGGLLVGDGPNEGIDWPATEEYLTGEEVELRNAVRADSKTFWNSSHAMFLLLERLSNVRRALAESPTSVMVDDGEVSATPEGDGWRLTVQIDAEGNAVSHLLSAGDAAALSAVLRPDHNQPLDLGAAT